MKRVVMLVMLVVMSAVVRGEEACVMVGELERVVVGRGGEVKVKVEVEKVVGDGGGVKEGRVVGKKLGGVLWRGGKRERKEMEKRWEGRRVMVVEVGGRVWVGDVEGDGDLREFLRVSMNAEVYEKGGELTKMEYGAGKGERKVRVMFVEEVKRNGK